jgi:hypothetical protein
MIAILLWDEEWWPHFEKEVDALFILHNGSVWPHPAFKSLIIWNFLSNSSSFYSSFPWQVKQERTRVVDLGVAPCHKCQS